MASRNQESSLLVMRPFLQMIRNLMGKNTTNTVVLTGDVVEEETLLRDIKSTHTLYMAYWVHYQIATLCYIFGDYTRASCHIIQARVLTKNPFSSVEVAFVILLDALIHLAPGSHQSMGTAKRHLRTLRKLSRANPVNVLGRLYILQAVLAATSQQRQRATAKFLTARAMAAQSLFRHDLAMILERMADFTVDTVERRELYRQAYATYREWGATAKAVQLQTRHQL